MQFHRLQYHCNIKVKLQRGMTCCKDWENGTYRSFLGDILNDNPWITASVTRLHMPHGTPSFELSELERHIGEQQATYKCSSPSPHLPCGLNTLTAVVHELSFNSAPPSSIAGAAEKVASTYKEGWEVGLDG